QYGITGEAFLRAATVEDEGGATTRVYIQAIPSNCVTDFDEDERGNITPLRYEVQRYREKENGDKQAYTYVEVWDKETGVRVWEHDKGFELPETQLGQPDPERSKSLDEMGIDFVPWAHGSLLKATSDKWGAPRYW